jgi:hypothetical protein
MASQMRGDGRSAPAVRRGVTDRQHGARRRGYDLLGDTERERTRRGRRGGDPIEPSARIGKSRSPEENPTPPEPMSESDVSRRATFFSLALVASVSPYWFARQFS